MVTHTGWGLYMQDTSGHLSFLNPGVTAINSTKTISANVWTHVVVTVPSGSTNPTFYINAVSDPVIDVNAITAPIASDRVIIGAWFARDSDFFKGSIDDVRIYNRALSAAEVKQLYGVGAANVGHSNTVAFSNGLVGYWTFDGSATNWRTNTTADISGNGNFGKLSTLSTSTTPVAGKIGQAFTFRESSQYVRIEDAPSLDVGDLVSYSLWIKRARTGILEVFFSKYITTAVGAFESANTVSLYKHGGGLIISTTATIADTKFHHLVFTKNGAAAKIYIDGALAASTNSASAFFANNDRPFCLGSDVTTSQCTGLDFKGAIDDMRVYSRELSAAEVKQLYNMGR